MFHNGTCKNLRKLLSSDGSASDLDIIESVEWMLREAASLRSEMEQLREDGLRRCSWPED